MTSIGPSGPHRPRGPGEIRQTSPAPGETTARPTPGDKGLHAADGLTKSHGPALPRSGWASRSALMSEIARSGQHRRALHPRPNFRLLFTAMRQRLANLVEARQSPPNLVPVYGGPMLGTGVQVDPKPTMMLLYGIMPQDHGGAATEAPGLAMKYGILPGGLAPPGGDPEVVMKYGAPPGGGGGDGEPTVVMKYGAPPDGD